MEFCKSMSIIDKVRKNKHFCATIGSLNLGALCVGLAIGWPRPAFTYLYDSTELSTHPELVFVDEVWVESMINVGASLGSLASIFISGFYGRRTSFSLSAAILVTFWIFLGFSGVDKVLIISAALVAGLGVGIFSATAVLYVAEISTLKSRGLVGTTVMLFGCLGIFAINLFGYFVDISIILRLMAGLPLCFLASVYFWMIESPFYLFQKGTVLEAKISLKRLRDRHNILEIDEEYKSMEAFFNINFSKETWQLLQESLCPKSFRPLSLITAPVLCISQMLGVVALSDYAEQLIESISPYAGTLVTSFIDVVSTVLCIFAIERFGRKALLIFTIVGSSLCCFILAVCNLVEGGECYTQEVLFRILVMCRITFLRFFMLVAFPRGLLQLLSGQKILPMVILCIYYAIYALGFTPVLPIVTGEIFPCRAKTTAVGICTSLLYLVAFCVQRSYQALNQYTSSCFAFVCFAMLGSIGFPFVVTMLPETQGKSLLQIQTELENGVMLNY